ncbi:MAG: COX15/CtaA family protein [Actinomycetota bacterium]|nr:COX15/CtaA family protein [Actinomycetota bacterium]
MAVSPALFRRVALVTAWMIGALIVSGGAVRLTGSGLGCPDWPTCTQHHLVAALSFHPMVEFVNRLVNVVGTIVICAVAIASLLRAPRRRDLVRLAWLLVAGVVAQIVVGGLVVLSKLAPPVVMAHFLLTVAMLGVAVVLHWRAAHPEGERIALVGRDVVWLSRLVVGLLALVIAIGTAVTGSGPHSGAPGTPRLPFAFHDAAELHADAVWLLVGLTVALLVVLRSTRAPAAIRHRGRVVLVVMAAQGTIGYTQYFTHVPALLVGAHLAGASLLWAVVVRFHVGLAATRQGCGQPPVPALPGDEEARLVPAALGAAPAVAGAAR